MSDELTGCTQVYLRKGTIVIESAEGEAPLDEQALRQYRKKVLTSAVRMPADFTVRTSEGWLHCEDGWLCLDARGYPYPVAADEFSLIYEEA